MFIWVLRHQKTSTHEGALGSDTLELICSPIMILYVQVFQECEAGVLTFPRSKIFMFIALISGGYRDFECPLIGVNERRSPKCTRASTQSLNSTAHLVVTGGKADEFRGLGPVYLNTYMF
jgi:hypothetical protein